MKKIIRFIAICSLLFAGCGKKSKTTTVEASRENSTVTESEAYDEQVVNCLITPEILRKEKKS